MLKTGQAKKLSIYVDESDKFQGRPVYEVITEILRKKGIAGLSVFRAISGFGSDRHLHTTKLESLSVNLPLKIEVVDSEQNISRILPDIYHVVQKGLIEVTDTTVIKCFYPATEQKLEATHMKLEGKAKMLRIIVSEDDKWEGEPLYEAIVKRLIMMDIAGATVYKAFAGYGPHRRYHKKKTLALHGELPMLITVVDTEENINKVLPVLDDMVKEGIVILSDVNVIKYTHRDVA